MAILPRGETRHRQRFAESTADSFADFLTKNPNAVPDLYPGYRAEMHDILGRFFVPNMDIRGNTVVLSTPKRYQNADSIGLIAVHGGERIVMDRWLVGPSSKQSAQHAQFLQSHEAPGKYTGEVARHMRDGLANASATEVMRRDVYAQGWSYGYTFGDAPFFNRRTHEIFGYATFRCMTPLALNIDTPPSLPTTAHEIDHLVRMDGEGIIEDSKPSARADEMAAEQRGYFVNLRVARYLISTGGNSADLLEEAAVCDAIDGVRRQHLGDGPNFGYSRELVQGYLAEDLLDFVLSPDMQPPQNP